jgi:hypothetical protein
MRNRICGDQAGPAVRTELSAWTPRVPDARYLA